MTIFRFSAAFLAAAAATCTGRPSADTELGKIVRIQNYSEAADQLQQFAEARAKNPRALRSELENSGFKRSVFVDGPDEPECERFDLKTKDIFPSVYFVTICSGKVFAGAGQQAP